MPILVIAKHDNSTLNDATARTVSAAKKIGGDVHMLVAGQNAAGAVQAARTLVDRAEECVRSITLRLHRLPEAHDPVWRSLGPELLSWRPL